jgi:hypothetical protein
LFSFVHLKPAYCSVGVGPASRRLDITSRQCQTLPARATFLAHVPGCRPESPMPNLAPLPLHRDAGGIADLDPDAAGAGSIRPRRSPSKMPSAPSRQACANTVGPSSIMCSLSRMPASVSCPLARAASVVLSSPSMRKTLRSQAVGTPNTWPILIVQISPVWARS